MDRDTEKEIRLVYRLNSDNAAFEIFELNNVKYEDICRVLGLGVANNYSDWIYYNIK